MFLMLLWLEDTMVDAMKLALECDKNIMSWLLLCVCLTLWELWYVEKPMGSGVQALLCFTIFTCKTRMG